MPVIPTLAALAPLHAAAAAPTAPADLAVVVGRFQPLHLDHLACIQQALAAAAQVVIVLGAAHQARTPRNPFTVAERAEMIRQALPPTLQHRVHVLPLRDHPHPSTWAQGLCASVLALQSQLGLGPTVRTVWLGHAADDAFAAVHRLTGWAFEPVPRPAQVDGAKVRDAYFASPPEAMDAALAALVEAVPASTRAFLRAWAALPAFAAMAQEWRLLRSYEAAWQGSPYPPVFVTVDSVVRCAGHVLLVRRGQAPGLGLLALPGGFIEPRDTTLQSALRELDEETHLGVPRAVLLDHLAGRAVFDHPDRSQRVRTITHGFFFDLPGSLLPAVEAGDDAAGAAWVPQSQLHLLEDQFLDDHFHILAQFLGGLDK